MAEHDTAALEARIIQDAKIPRGSQYRTGGVLLRMADDQLRAVVLPELLKAGEGHLAATKSVPLVAGVSRVRMPYRAVRLLDVHLLNAEGTPVQRFSRATPTQEREARGQGLVRKSGAPRLWYLEGSTVVLSPAPDATGRYTLVLRFARRPSRLVAPTAAWRVEEFNPSTLNIVVTGLAAPGVGEMLDVVRGSPGFESALDDVKVTVSTPGVGVSTVQLQDYPTESLEPGDYLTMAGTSPVPQLPLDYHAVLAQAVVVQVLKELRDVEGMAAAKSMLDSMLASTLSTIESRSSEPEVIVQRDWL